MTSFPGRNGRRRRVLNEEVLSASSSHLAVRAAHDEDHAAYDAQRYSDAAGVEHHPQVTDFVPRRYRSLAAVGLSGVATVAVLVGLNAFALPIAAALGMTDTAPFDLSSRGSIADWAAAVVLLAASAICMLVYSIRRHRIDDIRGRYRVWFMAAMACLLLSINSVASLHTVLASALTHVTGWTALPGSAAWWLAFAGLPMAWICLRALLDARECRLAGLLLVVSLCCYGVALATYLGWLPAMESRTDSSLTAGGQLLGHWSLLLGIVAYARYVILDAQGLIAVRTHAKGQIKSGQTLASASPRPRLQVVGDGAADAQDSFERGSSRQSADETEWVDGSRPERDHFGDEEASDGDRKLSKADRKRLRKFKAQNRAA